MDDEKIKMYFFALECYELTKKKKDDFQFLNCIEEKQRPAYIITFMTQPIAPIVPTYPLNNSTYPPTVVAYYTPATEVDETIPESRGEIISELLLEGIKNAMTLASYIETSKVKPQTRRTSEPSISGFDGKIHPIFLQKLTHMDFMSNTHFIRYWTIKKGILKGKIKATGYGETESYILQEIMTDHDDYAVVIIGKDSDTNKLFVDIHSGRIPDQMDDKWVRRAILGYDVEYDEYIKQLQTYDVISATRVRIQGDLKMHIHATQSSDEWAKRVILRSYIDELIWYLYRKHKGMKLLRKYIMSPMPIFLRYLIGQKNYRYEGDLIDDFIDNLIMKYPNIVDKFIASKVRNFKIYVGRPPNPHVVIIKNAIRVRRLGNEEFITTKTSKIIVKHPEHGVKEIQLPLVASVQFYI